MVILFQDLMLVTLYCLYCVALFSFVLFQLYFNLYCFDELFIFK